MLPTCSIQAMLAKSRATVVAMRVNNGREIKSSLLLTQAVASHTGLNIRYKWKIVVEPGPVTENILVKCKLLVAEGFEAFGHKICGRAVAPGFKEPLDTDPLVP